MPKFDASAVADPLEYDFTTVKGYKYKSAHGVIPEPTDDQIAAFIDEIRGMMKDAGSITGADTDMDITNPAAFFGQLDSYDPQKFLGVFQGVTRAYANLCSGHPSADQISALPLRIRVRFFAWVMEEVVSPEAGTGAGLAVVTPLRSAVAG